MPSTALPRRGADPDLARRHFVLGLAAAGLVGCAAPSADRPPRGVVVSNAIVPFSMSPADGTLPVGWVPYVMRRDLAPTQYRMVERDGRRVLEAGGIGVSSGLQCPMSADPLAQPWLRWQWRVDHLHSGMCVCDGDTDDAPARVVVAFDGDLSRLSTRERGFFDLVELLTGRRLPYATLMYVWDANLPVGQVVRYERSARIQYMVVESGDGHAGQWIRHERNVVDDFRAVFGEDPPGRISSVGVLSDSDDLKVPVKAWYGDIGLFAA